VLFSSEFLATVFLCLRASTIRLPA
jgi:hypothetical protein